MNDYEYCFSLAIIGGERSPEELTRLVGIEPTSSHGKGEQRATRGGKLREGVWPSNYWSCELPVVADASISESIAALVKHLQPHRAVFSALVRDGADISLFVGVFANRLCDDQFSPGLLKELGELGIALRLDYYSNDSTKSLVDDLSSA